MWLFFKMHWKFLIFTVREFDGDGSFLIQIIAWTEFRTIFCIKRSKNKRANLERVSLGHARGRQGPDLPVKLN